MNKRQAVQIIAMSAAGSLAAGSIEEATGFPEDELSEADRGRLEWAIEEVRRRLYRMGDTRADPTTVKLTPVEADEW